MKKIVIQRPPEITARIAELNLLRDDLATRQREAERQRFALATADNSQAASDPAAARVAALLGNTAPEIVPERRTALAQLAQQIFDLKAAIELLDRQIAVENTKASAAICAAVAPEYRNRIRAVVDALKGVHIANVALSEMTDTLEAEGVSWSGLGVVSPRSIGGSSDPYSPIGLYMKDAADLGFIHPSDIPAELRQ